MGACRNGTTGLVFDLGIELTQLHEVRALAALVKRMVKSGLQLTSEERESAQGLINVVTINHRKDY